MAITIMKNDPVLEKIRIFLKNFKENIMENANMRLKIWKKRRE